MPLPSDGFLPPDYEAPKKASGYLKLEEGTHLLRILTSPMLGWVWWEDSEDGKKRTPKRVRTRQEIPREYQSNGQDGAKHFWIMKVWNHETKQVQILEVTQATIQEKLTKLAANKRWGSPLNYDIEIEREGKGLKTTYEVTAVSKEPLAQEVLDAIAAKQINLEALYDGGNPFSDELQDDAIPAAISAGDLRRIWGTAGRNGYDDEKVHALLKKLYGLKSVKQIDPAKVDEFIQAIQDTPPF